MACELFFSSGPIFFHCVERRKADESMDGLSEQMCIRYWITVWHARADRSKHYYAVVQYTEEYGYYYFSVFLEYGQDNCILQWKQCQTLVVFFYPLDLPISTLSFVIFRKEYGSHLRIQRKNWCILTDTPAACTSDHCRMQNEYDALDFVGKSENVFNCEFFFYELLI